MKTKDALQRGLEQYSTDTLRTMLRDYATNSMSAIGGTWERGRMLAIKLELKRREMP